MAFSSALGKRKGIKGNRRPYWDIMVSGAASLDMAQVDMAQADIDVSRNSLTTATASTMSLVVSGSGNTFNFVSGDQTNTSEYARGVRLVCSPVYHRSYAES